jgi:hypothetical protein
MFIIYGTTHAHNKNSLLIDIRNSSSEFPIQHVVLENESENIELFNFTYNDVTYGPGLFTSERRMSDQEILVCIVLLPNKLGKIKWDQVDQTNIPSSIQNISDLMVKIKAQLLKNDMRISQQISKSYNVYKKEGTQYFIYKSPTLLKFYNISSEFKLYPTENSYQTIYLESTPFSITDYNLIEENTLTKKKVIGKYFPLTNKVFISGEQYKQYPTNKVFHCWMLADAIIGPPVDVDLYSFVYAQNIGIITIESNFHGKNKTANNFFKIKSINNKKPDYYLMQLLNKK